MQSSVRILVLDDLPHHTDGSPLILIELVYCSQPLSNGVLGENAVWPCWVQDRLHDFDSIRERKILPSGSVHGVLEVEFLRPYRQPDIAGHSRAYDNTVKSSSRDGITSVL